MWGGGLGWYLAKHCKGSCSNHASSGGHLGHSLGRETAVAISSVLSWAQGSTLRPVSQRGVVTW